MRFTYRHVFCLYSMGVSIGDISKHNFTFYVEKFQIMNSFYLHHLSHWFKNIYWKSNRVFVQLKERFNYKVPVSISIFLHRHSKHLFQYDGEYYRIMKNDITIGWNKFGQNSCGSVCEIFFIFKFILLWWQTRCKTVSRLSTQKKNPNVLSPLRSMRSQPISKILCKMWCLHGEMQKMVLKCT